MKPAFALSLSYQGIVLLHRAAGGWRCVGEVAPDAPDLHAELDGLRAQAAALQPDLRCKLILPNDQIRYMTVETDSADADRTRSAVERALDDATPYPLEDLAFDTAQDGEVTHVAAVARETLAEAEAFAVDHGFEPVSFVAIPGDNPFLGEPFFGPTDLARAQPGAETVEADGIAVVVIGPAVMPPEEDTDTADEPPSDPPAQDAEEPEAPPLQFSSRRSGSDTHEATDEPAEDEVAVEPEPVAGAEDTLPKTETQPDAPAPDAQPEPEPQPEPQAKSEPDPEPRSETEQDPGPDPEKEPEPEPEQLAAPRSPGLTIPKAPPLPGDTTPIPVAGPGPGAGLDPEEEERRLTIFGARDSDLEGDRRKRVALAAAAVALLLLAGIAALAALSPDGGLAGWLDDEAAEPALTPAPRAKVDPAPAETAEVRELYQAGPAPTAPAVPDVLASLPAPTSVPLQDAPADPQSGTAQDTPPDAPALSDTDSAVLDALQDEAEAEAPPEPSGDPLAQGSESTALYAATGIWPVPPARPETPGVIALDDLYLASIDPNDLSQDAVALPPAAGYDGDGLPDTSPTPASPGRRFDLDDQGLVEATPDGTRNPDGVMVFLGAPPTLPPPAPLRFAEEPQADEDRARLAAFRPRSRPDGLAESNERARLGGRSLDELATLRPRTRPASLQAEAEALAVAAAASQAAQDAAAEFEATRMVVLRPKQRPANLDTTPRRTASLGSAVPQQSAAREPDSFVPRAVKPRAPSPTSVARQATMNNAINLRRMNLIGVYGKPSNRRALIRLPSGRYKKVKVGDRLDGGRIVAIGDSELRYQKSGRSVTLKMPRG
ncbi:hypothetical protein SAMN05444007_105127 [Cribrihabitans marinus]|uniref:Type IV pilus biogenesis protein PilP n=1 Tax=Cribrihabitans marinus TaxID=1227549 RepID=A0A1H6ZRE7_9RHOB|nr:hypothetical protein [Cribrihabitans marinus]GGH30731.1 hypothetical protein GCM10010973_21090 [Cribrihabitans marinus]SEJ52282.1 hypothetical protein SAMN05444007_105127 [Cribrihabitans marinus]